MVIKIAQPPEQKSNSPYNYPNFSRYEYPRDDEKYAEHHWLFPHWDDEMDEFATPGGNLRSSHYTRGIGKDRQSEQEYDYFSQNDSSSSNEDTSDDYSTSIQSEVEEEQKNDEEGLVLCEELSDGIDSCRRDQKSDYDRFRTHLSSLSLELRALQQEIEAAEAACLNKTWNVSVSDQSSEIITDSESSVIARSPVPSVSAFGIARSLSPINIVESPSLPTNHNRRLIASSTTPSAIAMARHSKRSVASSPPRDDEFSPSSSPKPSQPYFSFHRISTPPNNSNANTTSSQNHIRCSIPEDNWTSDCSIREIPC
ncbi:14000_t:CDS:1 [Ambispora leptoticha]|uniref:14000_t:CDS:1 n=1 Tax=Ambispora leptoticha TaxID=144679 RepID=A0A9N9DCU6_9GLOM|nr:14000_t:CDS:1 [Ambispora leptoticha]